MTPRPKIHNQLPRREGILLAKARTFRWTQCNWFLTSIEQRTDPLCRTCEVVDDTEHVLNKCTIHEGPRSIMLQRLGHCGDVSDLLISGNRTVVQELANFLVKAEDERIKRAKEEEEKAREKAKEAKERAKEKRMGKRHTKISELWNSSKATPDMDNSHPH